ncbi:MAG: 30S ribosomal protein S4 [Nitrospirales bacterium]|nr:30S ribosomal protein S4 [Nitrospinota bacterium]
MANYTGPVCRICRREGVKLFLKGTRCMTDKCAIERRSYPPGQHGQGRSRATDYSAQLREKQKLRRMYGVLERQFRLTFKRAERQSGVTGENLLRLLEQRLDNVVYRIGFALSRKQARQLVNHGHILLNGKKADIASITTSVGDVITVKQKSHELLAITSALEVAEGRGAPGWIDVDREAFRGSINALPVKDDIGAPVNEQVIVELYSR